MLPRARQMGPDGIKGRQSPPSPALIPLASSAVFLTERLMCMAVSFTPVRDAGEARNRRRRDRVACAGRCASGDKTAPRAPRIRGNDHPVRGSYCCQVLRAGRQGQCRRARCRQNRYSELHRGQQKLHDFGRLWRRPSDGLVAHAGGITRSTAVLALPAASFLTDAIGGWRVHRDLTGNLSCPGRYLSSPPTAA